MSNTKVWPAALQMSSRTTAGSTIQTCPTEQNVKQPCDINRLELIFIDASGKVHKAIANEPRHLRKTPRQLNDLPHLENQKYQQVIHYDAILEVLAPALMADSTERKPARISAIANGLGRCPDNMHPKITMNNPRFDEHDELKASRTWILQTPTPMIVYGKPMSVDNPVGRFYLRDVLYMFEDAHSQSYIKDIVVQADGCGVRDDGKKPNIKLKGLIRVFREDKYVLELTLPSVYDKTASNKTELSINGNKQITEKKWSNDTSSSVTYSKDARMNNYSESKESYLFKTTQTISDQTNAITDTIKINEVIKLSRNGRQLNGLDTVNNIIKTRKSIVAGFNFFNELKDAVPQLGFGFSLKLDVLSGTIAGEWGLGMGSRHSTTEYQWVDVFGQINLALTLVKFEFAASFGVECRSPDILNWFGNPAWEVIAKIELKVSIDCQIKTALPLKGKSGAQKLTKIGKENSTNPNDLEDVLWTTALKSTIEFYGQFKITAAGYGMDTKAGVTGSVSVEMTVVKPFKIRGKSKRDEAYLFAYFTHAKKKKSPPWQLTLWKEKDILEECYLLS